MRSENSGHGCRAKKVCTRCTCGTGASATRGQAGFALRRDGAAMVGLLLAKTASPSARARLACADAESTGIYEVDREEAESHGAGLLLLSACPDCSSHTSPTGSTGKTEQVNPETGQVSRTACSSLCYPDRNSAGTARLRGIS